MLNVEPLDKWGIKEHEDEIRKTISESLPDYEKSQEGLLDTVMDNIEKKIFQVWIIARGYEKVAFMVAQIVPQKLPSNGGAPVVNRVFFIYAFRASVVVKNEEWEEGFTKISELAASCRCEEIVCQVTNPIVERELVARGAKLTKNYRLNLACLKEQSDAPEIKAP